MRTLDHTDFDFRKRLIGLPAMLSIYSMLLHFKTNYGSGAIDPFKRARNYKQGNSTRLCSSLSLDTVRAIGFASCVSGSPLCCLTFSKTTQLNTQGFLRSLLQFMLSCRKEVAVEIEARSADFCSGFFHLQYLPKSRRKLPHFT